MFRFILVMIIVFVCVCIEHGIRKYENNVKIANRHL